MRRALAVFISLFWLGLASQAVAQISLYNINTAHFAWTWYQGTGGMATEFWIECGTSSGAYTLPIYVVPVGSTLPADGLFQQAVKPVVANKLGTYYCVVYSANAVGVGGPTNELAFRLAAPPLSPGGLGMLAKLGEGA